jgi:anti-sigma factor RsiW
MNTTHFDEDQLTAYAGGHLETSQRAALEAHLPGCATCRADLLAIQYTLTVVGEAARELQRMPVHTHRGWASVRQRLHSPLAVRVRQASRRLSLQAAMSMLVVVMLFLSGVSINLARAAVPVVPFIQTPGTALQAITNSDTPTLAVTHAQDNSQTPTLTPIPGVTN